MEAHYALRFVGGTNFIYTHTYIHTHTHTHTYTYTYTVEPGYSNVSLYETWPTAADTVVPINFLLFTVTNNTH